jgi:predicted permease
VNLLARIRSFWRSAHRSDMERNLSEELQFHLVARAEDLAKRRGLSPEVAMRTARLEFGSVEKYREEARQSLGLAQVDQLRGDLRYAFRSFAKNKTFTAAAIISLALGIGANTAIFNLLETVLLRSLPVNRPNELIVLASRNAGAEANHLFSFNTYQALRRSNTLAGILASASIPMNAESDGTPGPTLTGQLVSGNYYELLGVGAALGRTITNGDDGAPGTAAIVVLSYGYWQRQFGGDPSVLGRSVRLNGYPFTIIGVSAPGFFGTHVGEPVDVTVPVSMQAQVTPSSENSLVSGPYANQFWLELIGRMRPGLDEARALGELQPIFQQQMEVARTLLGVKAAMLGHPRLEFEAGHTGLSALRQRFIRPLQILMAIVVLVLLVACGNVANLLLARGAARRREIAVRISLGASCARLVRQLVTESLVISCTGGAVGVLFTWLISDVSAGWLANGTREELSARPDWAVFVLALALSIATGLMFGVVPALRALEVDPQHDLKDGDARSAGTRSRLGHSSPLVVGQVALSLVLLIGAGLFARTLMNLQNVVLGFDAERVLTLRLEPRGSNQRGPNQVRLMQLYGTLIERARALPGVRAASLAGSGPIATENIVFLTHVPGAAPGGPIFVLRGAAGIGAEVSAAMTPIFPGYFSTLGISFLAGRDFEASENAVQVPAPPTSGNSMHVIVNKVMADRFLNGIAAVGRTFAVNPGPLTFQVVGIVADARERDVRKAANPTMYLAYANPVFGRGPMTLVVRTAGDAHAKAGAIRQLARASDESMPLSDIETVSDRVRASTAQERLVALLASVFGVLALAVAGIGLYGVVSYTVERRTTEIGIRMALGAARSHVLWTVLRSSLVLVGIGVAIGLAVALAVTRLVESQLFGLRPTDPATIFTAVLVIGMLGTIAGYLPARRAARVDPLIALRHE